MSYNTTDNSTLPGDAAGGPQNASTATVLWAIITLALTATSQTSFTAKYCGYAGASLGRTTSPYRASPIFCLFDSYFELRGILKRCIIHFELRGIVDRCMKAIRQNKSTEPSTAEHALHHTSETSPKPDNTSGRSQTPDNTADAPPRQSAPNQTSRSSPPPGITSDASTVQPCPDHTSEPSPQPKTTADASTVQPAQATQPPSKNDDVEFWQQMQPPVVQAIMDTLSCSVPVRLPERTIKADVATDEEKKEMIDLYRFIQWHSGSNRPELPRTERDLLIYIARYEAWSKSVAPSNIRDISAPVYCLKVSLFMLGALPQAIKIFAIRGIPMTQFLATIYLSAIMIHGLSNYLDAIRIGDVPESEDNADGKFFFQLFAEFSHWCFFINIWEEPRFMHRLPSNDVLGVIKELESPAAAVTSGILLSIVLTTPFSVYSRYALTMLPWFYIMSSIPSCMVRFIRYTGPQVGPLDWRVWYDALPYAKVGDSRWPLFAIPVLFCVGFSHLVRRSFLYISRVDTESRNNSHRLLQLLGEVAAEQSSTKIVDGHLRCDRRYEKILHEVQYALMRLAAGPFILPVSASRWFAHLPPDVQWTSYLALSLLSLMMIYTVRFDGSNTVQPAWTSFLG